MIRLGIIGVANPQFRDVYRPALRQLAHKTTISAIYDAVSKRAETAAEHCDADVCYSFETLIRRPDVDAVLLLSPGWYGVLPLVAAMNARKPALCTLDVWQSGRQGPELEKRSQQTDSLLVIESRYRYWPATLRSRELQACELGAPQQLTFLQPQQPADQAAESATLCHQLDWCRFLLQRSRLRSAKPAPPASWGIEFTRYRGNQLIDAMPVTWNLKRNDLPHSDAQPAAPAQLIIDCQSGTIEICGPHRLRWKTDAQTKFTEELLDEQSGIFRQLDHFCRRVAGGLIPVHDIADAVWAQTATHSLLNSQ